MSTGDFQMSWLAEQRELIGSLSGVEIASISAVEMALVDVGADGLPQFRHEGFPFIQCHVVELGLRDGRFAVFFNYQDDDIFGVMLEMRDATSIEKHWNDSYREGEPSIYRVAPDLDLSLGRIEDVKYWLDHRGNVSEIELAVSDRRILLKAGEVYEAPDGSLSVSGMDESVLLFLNASDISRVTFNPEEEWIRIVGRDNI